MNTLCHGRSVGAKFSPVEARSIGQSVAISGLDSAPGRACRGSGRELSSARLSELADQADIAGLVLRHRRCSIFARSPIPAIFDVRAAVPGDVPSDRTEVPPVCRGEAESQTCKTGLRMGNGVGDSPHVPKCPIVTGRVTYLRATDPPIDQGRLSVRVSLIPGGFDRNPLHRTNTFRTREADRRVVVEPARKLWRNWLPTRETGET